MNTNSNSYVMLFSVGMCVTVSTVLALLANGLRETQQAAAEFDRQKNVMMAAGLMKPGDSDDKSREQLEKLFADKVDEFTIDVKDGSTIDDEKLAADKRKEDPLRYRIVGAADTETGKVIILPISGKGLWSTIYGYIALEEDKEHVRGITFYKHGETPGLGGEVENPNWTAQWQGKSIRRKDGIGVIVKKGKVDESVPREKQHYVDGLAGATITSNGVTDFVERDLKSFEAYLSKN
jgi:Na+-transporting NADH:ubiquinone oxidoreductase subunit C